METQLGELPYRHTQTGYATLIGLVAGVVTQVGAFIRDLRDGRRRAWLYLAGLPFFAALMYAMSSLTVEVREDEIEVAFAGGLARRHIPLHEVTAVEATTTPWHYGWGIRLTPRGWLYNVWGRDAVTLSLESGRRFSVGTDEPQALLAAIETARGRGA